MKALIVGGGIAGTVCAIALHKAGLEPEIFEAFDCSADGVGAYLTLAVNGLDALAAVDIQPAQLGGFVTPRIAFHLGDGQALGEFVLGPERADGAMARTIKRSELYGTLRDEAVRRGIPITYGKRLVDAQASPQAKVVARFADGREAEGTLLIGADGLRSRVRDIIDPKAPAARYVGLLNTGGYAADIDAPGIPGKMYMFFGKRCFFCYLRNPGGEVWWFANPPRRREPTRGQLAAITADQWRAELIDLFANDAMPATKIINATAEIIPPWSTYDFPTVPIWHREHMIIIGDAAHATSPSSGQGASMAIEDAVVLAKCLRDQPDIGLAFRAYEALRRERVERAVAQGNKNGSRKAPGPIGRIVRDTVLRLVMRHSKPNDNAMSWIFDHRIAWR